MDTHETTDTTVYLDNAATTPLAREALEAMLPWLETGFGNPSSRHRLGVRAAQAVDAARVRVARAVGSRARDVVFTSGGTEANSLAVLGLSRARARRGRHALVGPTEHACVRVAARRLERDGFEVETTRLSPGGALDLEHLASLLRKDTVLVAQMAANNEFGTVYPSREVARLVRARSPHALLHVDAVQAFGKLDVSLVALGADTIALSAHKVHGPMGMGALIRAEGVELDAQILGGPQEDGLRAGTENVAGIVGFGVAAELAADHLERNAAHMRALRARFVAGLGALPSVELLEPGADELEPLPNVVAVIVEGAPSEVSMHHLEARDVIVSAGSACQGKKKELSPAMLALGLTPDKVRRLLRFSFSSRTTEREIDQALTALAEVCRELTPLRR